MTLSYSDNIITITSTKLADFGIITSATLVGYIDCGTIKYTKVVVSGDVTANTFTINEVLFSLSTLADLLITLTLTVVYNNGDDTTVENGCIFMNKDTSCAVAAIHSINPNEELVNDFFLLVNAYLGKCKCTDFCIIKTRLDNALENC